MRTILLLAYTGLSRAKLYELAGRGVIRSFSLHDPGSIKGSRFFHLQSVLDYLERAERREANHAEVSTDSVTPPAAPLPPPLKGQTVFLANTLTGGGHEYLIGVFASESDAWRLDRAARCWIAQHVLWQTAQQPPFLRYK